MKYFIELLQIALGNRSQLSQVPTALEWEGIFQEAQRQAIVGVLATGIECIPEAQRPEKELLLQWIGQIQLIESTNLAHQKRAADLTRLFLENGCHNCVLKGVGVSVCYPNPLRRQCGDIDLWVDGNRKDVMNFLRSHFKVGEIRWHHADAKIFDDVQTEIHFHATWLFNPVRNKRLQPWLNGNGICNATKGHDGFYYPTARFNAVYSLVHSFHHLLESGIGFRHIIDYYYISQTLSDEDRIEVCAELKRFGLDRFSGAMMWVLNEVCGMDEAYLLCEPNEKEGRFLLDEIMRGGNFGHYRSDNRKRNSATRMHALLPHYPSEVLWVVPWKLWHKCWRMVNG